MPIKDNPGVSDSRVRTVEAGESREPSSGDSGVGLSSNKGISSLFRGGTTDRSVSSNRLRRTDKVSEDLVWSGSNSVWSGLVVAIVSCSVCMLMIVLKEGACFAGFGRKGERGGGRSRLAGVGSGVHLSFPLVGGTASFRSCVILEPITVSEEAAAFWLE